PAATSTCRCRPATTSAACCCAWSRRVARTGSTPRPPSGRRSLAISHGYGHSKWSRLLLMPHDFVELAEHVADALLESDPHLASSAGDHRFDGRLPKLSAEAVAEDVAMLRDASTALSEVDIDALDQQLQVDHALLLARVERALFERTEVREHEWNPLVHNPGGLLHDLVSRPFAPAEERISSLAMRLARVPDALTDARIVLQDMPRVHVERAMGQFAGTAALVRNELAGLLAEAPALAKDVEPLQSTAARELDEFAAWLRAHLDGAAGAASAERDPRIGRRLWEARLW